MPNKHSLLTGHLKTIWWAMHTVGTAVRARSMHKAQSDAACKQYSRFLNSQNPFYRKIKANLKNWY